MVTLRICVLFLLFLSQAWAEEGQREMVHMKQEDGLDNSKTSITAHLEAELKELRDMVIKQKTDLSNKIEKLEAEKLVLDARLRSSESEVEELKRQNTENPKVAFSVGLTAPGFIGPFTTKTILKFTRVITNFGQVYNINTGLFTAPVRGVYFFRFTGYNWNYTGNLATGLSLFHNNDRVCDNHYRTNEVYESFSNGFVLELEKDDVVYMILPQSYALYDSYENRTVFSGFLIFPL